MKKIVFFICFPITWYAFLALADMLPNMVVQISLFFLTYLTVYWLYIGIILTAKTFKFLKGLVFHLPLYKK